MAHIDFPPQGINFWQAMSVVRANNIDSHLFLQAALKQDALPEKELALLEAFVLSLRGKNNQISSQLYQDAFAAFIIGDKYPKTFLEFGATDGVSLSNTFMLETHYGWSGLLCEPSPQWHSALFSNRNGARIITDCIWKNSEDWLDFYVSDAGVFSTLESFRASDAASMPGNTQKRNEAGRTVKVRTVSLNDVVEHYFEGDVPSFVSVDTEGSEYEILSAFDFQRYRPIVFTVEHNFTTLQGKIDELMENAGYRRVFRNLSAFDAWYAEAEALAGMAMPG